MHLLLQDQAQAVRYVRPFRNMTPAEATKKRYASASTRRDGQGFHQRAVFSSAYSKALFTMSYLVSFQLKKIMVV